MSKLKAILVAALGCVLAPPVHAFSTTIFFGYMDQRPDDQVEDNREKNYLRSLLARPCVAGQEFDQLCGFSIKYGEVVEATKRSAKGQLLHVKIFSSSVSALDSVNRGPLAQQQNRKSAQVREEFLSAFYQNAVVFYAGHARFGGGPDFWPPVIGRSGGPDKEYYRLKFTGEEEMLDMFARARPPAKLKIVGLYACDSKWHFEKTLGNSLPGVSLKFVGSPLKPRDITRALARDLNQIF